MKLIIIRHGQSKANKKGIHQGQTVDSPLSKEGKRQAEIVAGKLRNEDVEAIYSSDLKRAFETAVELEKILNIRIVKDKRLREFDMGEFDKTPDKREELFKEFYKKELAKGTSKYEIRPPEGENYWDFINRIKSFLEEIKKHNKTVIVYSHGGSIETALNILEGRDKEKDDFKRYYQENTAVNEIILENGNWKITKVNDLEHIKLEKPKKQLYEDQEKIHKELLEKIKEKIPRFIPEAYLFGSVIKK
ncbi:MAG: histidine phosphatase family protein, partial [Nanoarchaeota archaeon]|nr:histidine phosphatase family protein [Nanoarchaeota archaeon]